MQLRVLIDLFHEHNRLLRTIFLLDLEGACPSDVHVDCFARIVITVERRSIRAIWRDSKSEAVDHLLRAFLALCRTAVVPLDVNAHHSGRVGGFRLTEPYFPAPVEEVGTFSLRFVLSTSTLALASWRALMKALALALNGSTRSSTEVLFFRVRIGPRYPICATLHVRHIDSRSSEITGCRSPDRARCYHKAICGQFKVMVDAAARLPGSLHREICFGGAATGTAFRNMGALVISPSNAG